MNSWLCSFAHGGIPYNLASDGDGYVVIVSDGTHVFAQHVSGAGELLERSVVSIQQDFRAFVFAAGSYLLMDGDAKAHTIGVRRLDRAGKPVGGYLPLAEAPELGFEGALASNRSDTAALWTELRASARTVNGGVLHANATALTTAGPIARSANAQYAPRAATNGRNIGIGWRSSTSSEARVVATQTARTRSAARKQRCTGLNTFGRQLSTLLKVTSDGPAASETPSRFSQILWKRLRKGLCKTRKSAPNARF